jgi:hypothetical protein
MKGRKKDLEEVFGALGSETEYRRLKNSASAFGEMSAWKHIRHPQQS